MKLTRLLAAAYLLAFALLCAFLVPPWEPPDEPSHLFYVNYVARTGQLPNQYVPGLSVVGEGHQPPLYYAIGALLNRLSQPDASVDVQPVRNPKHVWNGGAAWYVPVYKHLSSTIFATARDRLGFYLLRLLSAGLALLNLLCMFKLFELLLPNRRLGLLAALWVVTLPQFAFMSGAVDNDNLANVFSTATIYWALRIVDEPLKRKNYVFAGLALGLGLLTKKTLLFSLPVVLTILVYVLFRQRKLARAATRSKDTAPPATEGSALPFGEVNRRDATRAILRRGLLLFAIAALLSGFFFVRNYRLYGEFLGTRMERNTLTELVQQKSLLSPYFLRTFPLDMFTSFVGKFGYMNVPLPMLAYLCYALIALVGVVGLLLRLLRGRLSDPKLALGALFALACLAGVVVYNLTYSMPQGRFLFPVLPLIAVFLTLGYQELAERLRTSASRRALIAGLVLVLLILDLASAVVLCRFYHLATQYG